MGRHTQLETILRLLSVLDPIVDEGDAEGTRQIALTTAKACDRLRLRASADVLRQLAHDEVEEWADARGMVEREALHTLLSELRPDVAHIDVSRMMTRKEGYVVPVRAEFTEEDGVDFVGWASGSMWVDMEDGTVTDVWVGDWTPMQYPLHLTGNDTDLALPEVVDGARWDCPDPRFTFECYTDEAHLYDAEAYAEAMQDDDALTPDPVARWEAQ